MKDEELVKKVAATQRSLKRQKIWDGLSTAAISILVGLFIFGVVNAKTRHEINRIHEEVDKLVKPECLQEKV
jgi:hypothetical protein